VAELSRAVLDRLGLRPRAVTVDKFQGQQAVSRVEDTEFGRKYTVPGELEGPAGAAQVLTVWIQETGHADVRLITVRPRRP
jgi:hypothetical protein